MDLNPEIFREYDIRGTVDKDLTDRSVAALARAMGTYLRQRGARAVSLASDNRLSSDGFRRILADGLAHSGLDVTDFGVIPTPVFYFTLFEQKMDGGVMITGSHNPPEFNGFKVASGRSTIYGEEIQRILSIASGGEFASGPGTVRTSDTRKDYVDDLRGRVEIARRLDVAVDCGNGTAAIVAKDLFDALGVNARLLYPEPDGRYPNHHPDPTVPANLGPLISAVREGGLEAGIAYDGDADRIGVIDETGDIIWGDRLLIVFAREILSRRPGAKIIFEVKCSQALPEAVEKAGGVPVMWKTGHSLIKEKMKEEGAALGGEMSGHIFFADRYYGYDDAIYASLRLFEILSRARTSMSGLLRDVPRYFTTPEIRVPCPDSLKFEIVGRLRDALRSGHKIIDIDGVRVAYPDGWGLVRASNTQPVLVLRFEAVTEGRLREIQNEVVTALVAAARGEIDVPEE